MGKFRSPITGYNHNVRHRGWVFHVQTEDSGVQNPHIFTHCFNGGVIVNTKKMVYDAIADAEVVKALMQAQHKSVLRELKKGVYDEKIDKYLGKAPEGADQGPEGPVAAGTPPPDGEAMATQPMPLVPDEILPERAGAPAQFDGVPQPVEEEVTAANSADIQLEADPPEGMEKAAERDRWQIREPAAVELPPPAAPAPPATSWVVQRAGRPVETPFEASAAYRDDATPPPTRLQQPRGHATVPPPAVTFSTPRGAAPVEARRGDTEIPPPTPPTPDEPPSGAFTINNRARKSISADMMDGPTTNAGRTGPAPWDSAAIPPSGPIKTRTIPPSSRPDPRHGDPRQNDARHYEPRNIDPRREDSAPRGDARFATSDPRHPDRQTGTPRNAPVRPAHHVAPGARPQPPQQNVIVSRPVVLGQREREAPAPPHGVRVPPARPTGQHSAPPSAVSEKSLDEVILAYLSEEAKGPK